MDAKWFLAKNLLETFNCTLLACYCDLCLRLYQLVFYNLEFLPVIQLWDHLQLSGIVINKAQHEGACEHKGKVEFLLLCFILP